MSPASPFPRTVPPSFTHCRSRHTFHPKSRHCTMSHAHRVYLYRLHSRSLSFQFPVSQSVSSCRHFLPYLEWKQSVCFCTHWERRKEGAAAERSVSVCVVGAPTALLAAPIKTRPRHLASLYNAPYVPSHCAHSPVNVKSKGRGSKHSR